MGELATCYAGATPLTSNPEYWENGSIPWISSGEVNKRTIYEADNYITPKGFAASSTKMVPSNSLLIALAGQGKTRGMVARTRIEACTNQSLCAIVPGDGIDAEYLFHFLLSQYKELRSMSSGEGGRGGLNLQIIKSILVPVPNIDVQKQIASALEAFSAISEDLANGLPAEIAARRKQYEYYRNKLLTFKELDVA